MPLYLELTLLINLVFPDEIPCKGIYLFPKAFYRVSGSFAASCLGIEQSPSTPCVLYVSGSELSCGSPWKWKWNHIFSVVSSCHAHPLGAGAI